MEFSILGCGAWSPWFENWDSFALALRSGELLAHESKAPAAAVIPSTERRRAPLPVKLAVEASSQACENAGVDPASLASIFVSGLGDTQLTDYMCKALASENKALSPTRFHNSVHNAAAGYWTISVGCEHASTSLAAFDTSVSMALLEAVVQLEEERRPVLLTFYDAPVAPILEPLLKNSDAFAFSMVLGPAGAATKPQLRLSTRNGSVDWPALALPENLARCYADNPAARSLVLAQMLTGAGTATDTATDTATKVQMPLSAGVILELDSEYAREA